ncbi:MAG: porin family protein [Epsilonproteobacteria bacterium]|nr:porin family protein [Campylobacterota bacterium]
MRIGAIFKILLIELVAIVALSAGDRELEKIFGVEFGRLNIEYKNVIGASLSSSNIVGGLKVGVQDYYWRSGFSTYYSKDGEQELFTSLISIDRYLFASMYEDKDNIVKPYIGFDMGWMSYSDLEIDGDGLTYGANIGIVWGLSIGVDIDLGYRYLVTSIDSIDSMDTISISLNYIF